MQGQPAPQPTLAEVFSDVASDGAAVGFVLSRLPARDGPVLWVQDFLSRRESGRPYLPGLPPGLRLLRVDVSRPADALRAMEDGLQCRSLRAVVGEIWGDPKALSFTATKRLALRAEHHDMPCWLIRRGAAANLSAARERWRLSSLPSTPHPDDPKSPHLPRWRAELFRARNAPPGEWVLNHDGTPDHQPAPAFLRDRTVGEVAPAAGRRAAG